MPKNKDQADRTQTPTLLALHHENDAVWTFQAAGMRRYAKMRGLAFRAVRVPLGTRAVRLVDEAIRAIRPAGVVSSLRMRLPSRMLRGIPAVYLDTTPDVVSARSPLFCHDAAITARLAVRELYAKDRRSYAYVGYSSSCVWSRERGAHFVAQLSGLGKKDVRKFVVAELLPRPVFDRKLKEWLETLPVPCGLFAANDELASQVVRCATQCGLKIPEELSVVGVDNNERICQKTVPTLSSIAPDWDAGSYMAAATLDSMMRGKRMPVSFRNEFKPLGLIRRSSSSSSPTRFGPFVLRALAKIRMCACEGLTVPQVVSEMRCSRRFAEKLFREVIGASILEEIRCVRFAAAKAALLNTRIQLSTVARRCGWESVTTFCREFRRVTGLTPGSWRRKNSLPDDHICAQTDN